jgi:hypothetical protein
VVWPNEPIRFLNYVLKYFLLFVSKSLRNSTFSFCAFHIFSVYIQIRSEYSQYKNRFFVFSIRTNRFILRTVCMRTDSFRIFGKCLGIELFFTAFKGTLHQKTVHSEHKKHSTRSTKEVSYLLGAITTVDVRDHSVFCLEGLDSLYTSS